jgi:internalin A
MTALELIAKEKKEKTGKLDLGRCGLTELPKELFELEWLDELFVSNKIWDSKEKKWIESKNDGHKNSLKLISPSIGKLRNLKKLHISGERYNKSEISDYSFLEKLINLHTIDLSYNKISDYSFLEKLSNLQSLVLSSNKISDISFLEKLSNLQSLVLSSNKISDISFLEKLSNLQSLVLSSNKISDISFLEKLSNLHTIDLSSNKISDINFLEKLSNLHTIDLRSNQISDISFLEKLINLQSLYLSSNQISDISFLSKLSNIQTLDLRNNKISDISFLSKLSKIQTLDLRNNHINDINFLSKLSKIQTLYLSSNQISDISFLSKLNKIQALYLRSNQISDIRFLYKLSNIQTLDLSSNQISDISFLSKLSNIHTLDLSDNPISDISFLYKLSNIQTLDLRFNQISDISFLSKLSNIQTLDLRNNQISDISFLSKLSNIQTLDLRNNQISDISFLSILSNIQTLDLDSNQISDITPLKKLINDRGLGINMERYGTGIRLKNNPLTSPPPEIVNKGRDAVVNWFEQMEVGEEPLYESKLMILGQGESGKTTLAELLLNENYVVRKGLKDSTLGVNIHRGKEYQHLGKIDQKITAHIWDFGGQDIQKMLHQFFITENCLYVIVSDKRAENARFDYWFQIINLLGPKSSVIVLENRINIESSTEDFPLNKYRELYKSLTIECIEVNLKHTRDKEKNNWQWFNNLVQKKLSALEIVNRPVPIKWSKVRDELKKISDRKYISKDAFYSICAQTGIELSIDQSDLCLFYLSVLGDLEYFNDKELCNCIFLDHNWLTKGLYYILSDNKIKQNNGRFTRQEAYEQWNSFGYNEAEKQMLLQLLLKDKFDICYELKHEKDVFITPLMLPADKPEKWKFETKLHFRYQYNFLPHGMFSRLIVRLHEKNDCEKKWKTGVRLTDKINNENVHAEVQQFIDPNSSQKVIDIKINGSKNACKDLLTFIRNEMGILHRDFKNINFQQIVGCNCETCASLVALGEQPSFYDFKKLQTKIANRRYYEECPNSNYDAVNIGQVLSDVIVENAAKDNIDNNFLHQLKEMGMSINQIKNVNKIGDVSAMVKDSGNATVDVKQKTEIKIDIQIIQELIGEIENLKEDIDRELKIKNIPPEEIEFAKSDVEVFENAIKAVEKASNDDQEIPTKSKSRLKRFWEDIQDENSSIHKTLKILRKGKDYGVKLAKLYNNIPGVPSIPPFALEVIDKL